MTDRELLETILEKITVIESEVCRIKEDVDEMDSESHGFARAEKVEEK
ncbi:MAG TPA: hypothetical protein VN611_17410 [Patescibacteria group bacterium]|nr:hypothetical protein [Patescibacteria group bacterium]